MSISSITINSELFLNMYVFHMKKIVNYLQNKLLTSPFGILDVSPQNFSRLSPERCKGISLDPSSDRKASNIQLGMSSSKIKSMQLYVQLFKIFINPFPLIFRLKLLKPHGIWNE